MKTLANFVVYAFFLLASWMASAELAGSNTEPQPLAIQGLTHDTR